MDLAQAAKCKRDRGAVCQFALGAVLRDAVLFYAMLYYATVISFSPRSFQPQWMGDGCWHSHSSYSIVSADHEVSTCLQV